MSTLSIILIIVGGLIVLAYLTSSIVKMKKDEKKAYNEYCEDLIKDFQSKKATNYKVPTYKEWKKLTKEEKQRFKQAKQIKHVEFDEEEE